MSLFMKDQWKDWARAWGLAHRPQRGWLNRSERVLGERKGLLIRAGWGDDTDPGIVIRVRFPKAGDLERLRQALIADASLDTLPGKGAARRKMVIINDGPKKVIHIGHAEFTLAPDSLTWRRDAFTMPKTDLVREWTDTLVAAVARATPVFDGRCETCGTGVTRHYVVVDDHPVMMCGSCQQRVRAEGDIAERTYDMIEVRHLPGTMLALGAGMAGALVWAGLAALTQRVYSIVAIGIGALVAWAYRYGAKRVDPMGRAIAAALTLVSVTLGEIVLFAWWVAQANPAVGFRLDAGWEVYWRTWAESPRDEIFTLLCALGGAWVAGQVLVRPKLAPKIEPEVGPEAEQRKAA